MAVLAVASAVAGGWAGCHPTGSSILDPVYTGIAAGFVTLAASRSSRAALLLMAAVSVALSRNWLWIPSGAALLAAFGTTFLPRHNRRLAALIGTLAFQAALRWPAHGFHGFTALMAGASLVPAGISWWNHRGVQTRRAAKLWGRAALGLVAVLAVPVVTGILVARSQATKGLAEAKSALKALNTGDTARATADLRAASSELATAHTWAGNWWTAGGLLLPVVAQQRRAFSSAVSAAHYLTASAERVAPQLDYQSISQHNGEINLAAVAALGAPLKALDAQALVAEKAVHRIHTDWTLPPLHREIQHLTKDVQRAKTDAAIGVEAVKTVPSLLGGDGPRRYLVAFMNPAETRGLDGLIGSFAIVTVSQGHMSLSSASTWRTLDPILQAHPFQLTGLPEYQARYGAFHPTLHFEDAAYSPDFPTDAQVITQMYQHATGVTVDGVMALDPAALAALIPFTGPIPIPGLPVPLTQKNTEDILLRQQYVAFPNDPTGRHDVLLEALNQAVSRITSRPFPKPKLLANELGPAVQDGHLYFWSNYKADQRLLLDLGIAGAFPDPGPNTDVLAVTIANGANNKVDAYLHESINDHVVVDRATGHVQATVTVTLTNDAPSTGLPAYVIGSYAGSGLPPGSDYLWISIYSRMQLDSISVDDTPTGYSPAERELGSHAYSFFSVLASGATKRFVLNLEETLPRNVSYRTETRLQPLANIGASRS